MQVQSRSISPKTPLKASASPRRIPQENLSHTPVTSKGHMNMAFVSQKPPDRIMPRLGSYDNKSQMTGQL